MGHELARSLAWRDLALKEIAERERSRLQKSFPWMDEEALNRSLDYEINELQRACRHPAMPERNLGEEYMDTCPDCGYAVYCYRIG